MTTISKKMLLVLGVTAGIISSCNKNGGFEKTENGLLYKFHVENEDAKKPKVGDVLFVNLVYKSGDSVLFDTRTINKGEPTPTILTKPNFKGDLVEGYALMHIGDSATFKVNADTFFFKMTGRTDLPPGVKKGSELVVDVKLYKIQSEQDYKKAEAIKTQQMQAKEFETIAKYMTANNIIATKTASGLFYSEIKKGSGKKAEPNKTVAVHYKGSFLSGSVFDSSIERGKPIEFAIGTGQVIPGWDEAIMLMQEGGKAKVIIPWWLAYGPNGYGQAIPPFATLVFEMELVSVK